MLRRAPLSGSQYETGLSYIEVLVASLLLLLLIVPALNSLMLASSAVDINTENTDLFYRLADRMEVVLAEPYSELEKAADEAGSNIIPSAYSDTPGTPDRRIVYIARYDADDADNDSNPFSGSDVGILWVRVEIENTSMVLETLIDYAKD